MKMLIRTYGIVFFLLATAATAFAQQPAFDMGDVPEGHAVAILAGGCFWCMEPPYDKMDGVVETISGYTGGSVANPTYRQVVRNNTGHYEAILLVYDPDTVSYEELLDTFWVNVDPLDAGGQFCDRGDSYRTGIFALDAKQRRAAEQSIRELDESDRLRFPVVTEVMDADTFYVAEEYHQDYYRKNPLRYRTYRTGCGRDARLRQLWGADAPY
ncbi:MAG: peptide-methionine (S)-S-oxide reductase MsrA [Spirochaeta sp.]|jgi:peptide-methionine (S)-S-oxide reductase|nr:peptide-methionine (S)-S-oxide reductase MsrA [Spirochaeta sp.]